MVVPYARHGATLDECLEHLRRQTLGSFEIILVPDETAPVVPPNTRVIAQPGLPNRKRLAAALATGAELLAFLDDDAYPDPEWLAAAIAHFEDPGVIAVGGPAVTPPGDAARARASGAVYASPLVTAPVRHRYLARGTRTIDALPSCNMLMRRAAFLTHAPRTLNFFPGEDMLVCDAARTAGGRIVYDPRVLVFHHRRPLFGPHLRQVWSYALFRGWYLRRRPTVRSIVYAAPAALTVATAVAVAGLSQRRLRVPIALAAAAYTLAIGVSAIREARVARANAADVALGIVLTHWTYGAGTIAGWFRRNLGA